MKSIVEKIFYGNLRPNDDINKYAEKEVQEMLSAEKKLVEVMSEEQRELYEEYQTLIIDERLYRKSQILTL